MNQQRRTMLVRAIEEVSTAETCLQKATDNLGKVAEGEKTYLERMPAPLKASKKGAMAQKVVEEAQRAIAVIQQLDVARVGEIVRQVDDFPEEEPPVDPREAALHALEALNGKRPKKEVIQELQRFLS